MDCYQNKPETTVQEFKTVFDYLSEKCKTAIDHDAMPTPAPIRQLRAIGILHSISYICFSTACFKLAQQLTSLKNPRRSESLTTFAHTEPQASKVFYLQGYKGSTRAKQLF